VATAERPPAQLRILLADDHAVVRLGLRALVEGQTDMRVVGEAVDAAEVVAHVLRDPPDVVLLDLSMPGGGGLAVLEALRKATVATRVVILTMHGDPAYIRAAFSAGAHGYVIKRALANEVLTAIRTVASGHRYVDPGTTGTVLRDLLGDDPPPGTPAPRLSSALSTREREVLLLLAEGRTNQEVGDHLGISVKTVESHRARLYQKLDARSRADLVRYALNSGLLSPDRMGSPSP
jgi:two-component system, NarL family, response regulator NreC